MKDTVSPTREPRSKKQQTLRFGRAFAFVSFAVLVALLVYLFFGMVLTQVLPTGFCEISSSLLRGFCEDTGGGGRYVKISVMLSSTLKALKTLAIPEAENYINPRPSPLRIEYRGLPFSRGF
jgi:hypothetical protein